MLARAEIDGYWKEIRIQNHIYQVTEKIGFSVL